MRKQTPLAVTVAIALIAVALGASGDRVRSAGQIAGDADCSTAVDTLDGLQVMRDSAGLSTSAGCLDAADVDCDSDIDAADVLRILRFAASLPLTTPDGCTPIGEPLVPQESGPTTAQVIDAAVSSGEIDAGTGLVYQVFAAFGDPRLPEEYLGAATAVREITILREAAARFSELSPEQQALVAPFLEPPSAPGGWYEGADSSSFASQSIDWSTVSGERVKVWWHTDRPEDEAKVNAILEEVETVIWDKLVDLMGPDHPPLSDWDQPNNGGDEKFDIYLVNPPKFKDSDGNEFEVAGFASGYADACTSTPAYLVLSRSAPLNDKLFSTVAHELFHAVQFGFAVGDCDEYEWMVESTAVWAESYVYPSVNEEHGFAPFFLDKNRLQPLDEYAYGDYYQYGAYLWFYYLTQSTGRPSLIRDAWLASGNPDSVAAVESAITGDGGFDELYPLFAVANYNQEPVTDYNDWDDLTAHATVPAPGTVATTEDEMLADGTPYLGARHNYYDVPDAIQYVKIHNTLTEVPGAHLWGIVKADGEWKDPEDWSDKKDITFCRDMEGQDVEELIIIITNTAWQSGEAIDTGHGPTIKGEESGCKAYVGTATMTYTMNETSQQFTTTSDTTGVRFEVAEDLPPIPGQAPAYYRAVSGSTSWAYHGEVGIDTVCTFEGSGTYSVTPDWALLNIDRDSEDPPDQTALYGLIGTYPALEEMPTVTMSCPNADPLEVYPDHLQHLTWAAIPGDGTHRIDEDGHLRGTHIDEDGNGGVATWTWDFAPAP